MMQKLRKLWFGCVARFGLDFGGRGKKEREKKRKYNQLSGCNQTEDKKYILN